MRKINVFIVILSYTRSNRSRIQIYKTTLTFTYTIFCIILTYNYFESSIFIFEGSIDNIKKSIKATPIKISKPILFPSINRDIAIQIDYEVPSGEVQDFIIKHGGEFLSSVQLFDLYQDEKLGTNKKSLAYSLKFESPERTLVDNEADKWVDNIIKNLKIKFNITQR